eukprot:CAMPEP_0201595702 /NCGR_PEP_ID=MMETSP0190_2-20130828/192618_1 /ASSEMBLY_ACC=CAM_ASM_000263 /TAXON_ID=37353 /ORGANISM="Rosalina sp." /LENGTH=279 /DNA_ID=CAMNT_0048055779 /DNA_START=643 /DNA_END=1483 /DNA_ORIENTATION=-
MSQQPSSVDDKDKDKEEDTTKTTTNPNAKYIMNNNGNGNSNNGDKNQMDVDTDKEKKKRNKILKQKKSSSSYYLYKSTDPEQAKAYKPKKVDVLTAVSIESAKIDKGLSSFNKNGTTAEAGGPQLHNVYRRLNELLKSLKFKNSNIVIKKVEIDKYDSSTNKIDDDELFAYYNWTGSKWQAMLQIPKLKLEYGEDNGDDEDKYGTITSGDDGDDITTLDGDWKETSNFKLKATKGKKKDDEQKKKIDEAKRIMKGSIDLIITTIDGYLDEFIASLPAKK